MTAAVESMAYAGQVPWHGLGVKVADSLTPKEILKAANLNWTVDKVPLGVMIPATEDKAPEYSGRLVPGKFALQRNTDGRILSVVGSQYKPVQNEEAFDFFKKFTDAGHMKMETAGSLKDGKFVWGLARVADTFKVGGRGSDEIENFLLLMSPFEANRSLMAFYTSVRVVCWNTLSMALGAAMYKEGGKGPYKAREGQRVFRMPHIQKFDDDVKASAEEALGLAATHVTEFKAIANLLASKAISEQSTHEYFFKVLKVSTEKQDEIKGDEAKKPELLQKLEHALEHAPGQQIASAKGTWWGALNAVTYVIDHEVGRTRDSGLYRAWLGSGSALKRRAMTLAVDEAKAA